MTLSLDCKNAGGSSIIRYWLLPRRLIFFNILVHWTRTDRYCNIGRRACRFASCPSSFSDKKKIVVFDDPEPSRNAASHGIHNFIGFLIFSLFILPQVQDQISIPLYITIQLSIIRVWDRYLEIPSNLQYTPVVEDMVFAIFEDSKCS